MSLVLGVLGDGALVGLFVGADVPGVVGLDVGNCVGDCVGDVLPHGGQSAHSSHFSPLSHTSLPLHFPFRARNDASARLREDAVVIRRQCNINFIVFDCNGILLHQ